MYCAPMYPVGTFHFKPKLHALRLYSMTSVATLSPSALYFNVSQLANMKISPRV